jgi:hypothetical protein
MAGHAARWRRHGKDRLYVTGADGVKLGYRDLLTGQEVLAEPARAGEFEALVAAWLAAQAPVPTKQTSAERAAPSVPAADPLPAGAPVGVVPEPRDEAPAAAEPAGRVDAPAAVPPEPRWEDLAQRPAGAMAREQALLLKEAAPVRTFVARMLGVHTDERAWRIGADGEEKVAAQLARLAGKDPRWRYLHAIPVGDNGSDIDHLVVGPGGVFSLNAKHHPGSRVWVGGNTLMVNGQHQPYIRNSRHEAARATNLLTAACGFPVFVTGLVVPVGADDVTIKTPPRDVHVVNRMRLGRWLRDRPTVLTEAQIEAIFDAARRSTTWRPPR